MANVRFKLRHFQNETGAKKNNSKQFLWIKLRELTDFRVVIMNSNDKENNGKLGQLVLVHFCRLIVFDVNAMLNLSTKN